MPLPLKTRIERSNRKLIEELLNNEIGLKAESEEIKLRNLEKDIDQIVIDEKNMLKN